jgi:uncharacterized repeat protein (TIGR04076 family)
MAIHPAFIEPFEAQVLEIKGTCSAAHHKGDKFSISCYDSGGLCGFFYHSIFPTLSVIQFGGDFPWSSPDEVILECPDRKNSLKLRIKRH